MISQNYQKSLILTTYKVIYLEWFTQLIQLRVHTHLQQALSFSISFTVSHTIPLFGLDGLEDIFTVGHTVDQNTFLTEAQLARHSLYLILKLWYNEWWVIDNFDSQTENKWWLLIILFIIVPSHALDKQTLDTINPRRANTSYDKP